jgi:hypothetical protein
VTPYSLVGVYQPSGGTCYFCLRGTRGRNAEREMLFLGIRAQKSIKILKKEGGNIMILKASGRDAVQFSGRVPTFWRNLLLLSSRHKRTQRRERNVTGTKKGKPTPEEQNFVHSHRTAAPVPYIGYRVLNTYLSGQNEQVFPTTCCRRKRKDPVTNMPF